MKTKIRRFAYNCHARGQLVKTPILVAAAYRDFPRFYISTARQTTVPKEYWNANDRRWVSAYREATLYHNGNEAALEIQRIQREQYAGKTLRKFVVPIEIELFGDEPISKEDLIVWMRKAMNFGLATGTNGNGPTENSLVIGRVNWDRTKDDAQDTSEPTPGIQLPFPQK